ncbi:MAG: hypothetical protein MUF83_14105 [Acidimicrobiales bacterium]|jgi:hypothetical protein|nr:hypothetical protein [Acidimicrobiales bacterium]
MRTFVLRLWLPDRPGALGAVASRIGSVGGDVVGIEILERGTGCAIDELVVELPDDTLVELMLAEVGQVDGVDVEDVLPMAESLRDPRLDALETAAMLVGASSPAEAVEELCFHASRTVGAEWGAVVALEQGDVLCAHGSPPGVAWLLAFVEGSRSSARLAGGGHGPDDVVWAPLPRAGLALVLGRDRTPFRARERHQVSALARIVDTRYGELRRHSARAVHPSAPG